MGLKSPHPRFNRNQNHYGYSIGDYERVAAQSYTKLIGQFEGRQRISLIMLWSTDVKERYYRKTEEFAGCVDGLHCHCLRIIMFTNDQRQVERTGKYGTSRLQYLQELVSQFQNTTDEETKERTVAHLANFAYDPYNYNFLRQLNVLELFLDCITEPNEKLVEFGAGGICNSCVDPENAAIITKCGGIPLMIQCLSSPVRNTVNYALGSLYYLCDASNKEEILKPEVVETIKRYAAAGADSVSFRNLAKAFLDKHVPE
ncbi:hypothetical protein NE237_021129 [Protea cynaroides]|uniref:Armadillo repeat-containing protein 7 n=1 Tax=Protea cynaroides TaxID=273540 RepID=A0A9Q0K2B4_9MAGN|nr:hypothetical protein NE237_021129 [Protea cynaroides]